MARTIPLVQNGRMLRTPRSVATDQVILVGSYEWFDWLQSARSFTYVHAAGRFTARMKTRQTHAYWYAVQRHGDHLHETYLGKASDLSLDRLRRALTTLARDAQDAALHSLETTNSRSIARRRTNLPAPVRVLPTKLAAPTIPAKSLVHTHVSDRLDDILGHPLSLVCAPAGYGKTTLLARWIATTPVQAAWVTLDKDDSDPARFWTYVTAALDRLIPGILDVVRPLLGIPSPDLVDNLVTLLASMLAEHVVPLVLVLDDYDNLAVGQTGMHASLMALIERLPSNTHIVVSSRHEPPFALARLRANRQVYELSAPDLTLDLEESTDFLRRHFGRRLSKSAAAILFKQTEGWVVGLQLALLSAPPEGNLDEWASQFGGGTRTVSDYLLEEVLNHLSTDQRAFVLQVAPLHEVTASLCDAVIDATGSQAQLEALEQANIFIQPLDARRQWYRFHPMFSAAATERLYRSYPDRASEIWTRASKWYETHEAPSQAVNFALRARDFDRVAHLLETYAAAGFQQEYLQLFVETLECIPMSIVCTRPRLLLLSAYAWLIRGEYRRFQQLLRQADEVYTQVATTQSGSEITQLAGELLALHSDVLRNFGHHMRPDAVTAELLSITRTGETEQALPGVKMCHQALAHLPADHPFRPFVLGNLAAGYTWDGEAQAALRTLDELRPERELNGDTYYTYQDIMLAGYVRLLCGNLHEAIALCRRTLFPTRHYGDRALARGLSMIQGMAHFARNELELAEHFLSQDLPLQHNTNLFLMSGYPARAYAQLAQGNSAKAHETVGQALALCTLAQIEHRRISPWVRRFLLAHQARLWLLEGKAEATTEWIQTLVTSCAGEHAASGPPTLLAEWEGIVLARARIATGEFQGALDLLETLGTQAAAASRIGRLLEILVLQAVAYARQSDAGRALDALRPALRLAEPEAAVRVFVEGGPLIQHLLELERAAPTQEKSLSPAENQPRVVDFVALLLAAFQPVKSGAADHELTEREVEVLRLLAGGAADKEIARVLRVALGTVKRHTNKIYMKLGVQSRTQAITRADALEIIKR